MSASKVIVWIDSKHATLYRESKAQVTTQKMHARDPEHHTHRMDREHDSIHLFKSVCAGLIGCDWILLLGPGVAKKRFQSYLDRHRPEISRKVVACMTTNNPTGSQIKDYFETMNASLNDVGGEEV